MTFYEFFAGGGMVRAGLGVQWRCLFANDDSPQKARIYRRNWGCEALVLADIAALTSADLPGAPDLVWGSFPCQDLSVAGAGAGLAGQRSGSFWSLIGLLHDLTDQGRAPPLIVLENVLGTLSANGGADFTALCRAVAGLGYDLGAVVIDAADFLPQSRPRLFIIAARKGITPPDAVLSKGPQSLWHPPAIVTAYQRLPQVLQKRWRWWAMPTPAPRVLKLADLIDLGLPADNWDTPLKTRKLLLMMNETHLQKVAAAKTQGGPMIGTIYKRTRSEQGQKFQRAEVRFDDLAGCLRTPGGGSSRQQLLVVSRDAIRSRLISPRETARLMGLSESYKLSEKASEAYHLTGDGVAVPVVRYLAKWLLEPLLSGINLSNQRTFCGDNLSLPENHFSIKIAGTKARRTC
ncbi:DNA (cytosine-5-)-methyltransferase [Sulfitobacter sp. M220]|uniref:DNA cytosine methyltransferase n=1 Tax=Sulfitobacter sp. M220 TaxID=2675333 RepID=UPI001F20C8DE|nr:DNA cytosine methyltransferase [Sulfitobacter sp. M220]MCF7779680.1 DNA (cytosine-5-)-methyltransferase [Sulfitobacter sp. M220]